MASAQVLIGLVIAQVVYSTAWRLLFSPIATIPGPKLAALTSWYEFYYDVIKGGKFVWHIQDLHEIYGKYATSISTPQELNFGGRVGPIVRITPWEIHISDPSFLDEIYPPASRIREKYAFFMKTLKMPGAIGATIKHETHRRRREALNPFFSKRSIVEFESIIVERVRKLQQIAEIHLQNQTPLNLSDAYFAFANDVVSYYCFGHDDSLLSNLSQAAVQRKNISELLLGVKVNQHFPWLFDLLDLIPFPIAKNIMPPGVLDMMALTERITKEIQDVFSDTTDARKGSKRSIFYELRDNKDLPASEKRVARLADEGTLMVMAGTDSTAKSTAIIHFYLMNNPEVMEKVRLELRSLTETASWSELERLPYLSGCIAEGNRLSFGVTARLCRIAPTETLQYKQYAIPPGTPVSETTLSVHTNETIFPDPWEFRPERWIGKEGVERRKYQLAFNKGARSCVGINLAHAEMLLTIAAMARYDMKLFETDIRDVKFQHEFHVGFPRLDSKGVRAIVEARVL